MGHSWKPPRRPGQSDSRRCLRLRAWVTVSAASFGAIPSVLPFGTETFVLLLAADARGVSDQGLRDLSSKLLKAGARYVCFWGPDCSRVHDACDLAAMELGFNRGDTVMMTTWHVREPLKEAVWLAANAAFPDEAYSEAGGTLVAMSVGSKEWSDEISEYLQAGTPIQDEA